MGRGTEKGEMKRGGTRIKGVGVMQDAGDGDERRIEMERKGGEDKKPKGEKGCEKRNLLLKA